MSLKIVAMFQAALTSPWHNNREPVKGEKLTFAPKLTREKNDGDKCIDTRHCVMLAIVSARGPPLKPRFKARGETKTNPSTTEVMFNPNIKIIVGSITRWAIKYDIITGATAYLSRTMK